MIMLNDNTIEMIQFSNEEMDHDYQKLSDYEKKVLALQSLQEQIYRREEALPTKINSQLLHTFKIRERQLEKEINALIELGEDYDE